MKKGRLHRRPFVFNLTFKNLTEYLYAAGLQKVTLI